MATRSHKDCGFVQSRGGGGRWVAAVTMACVALAAIPTAALALTSPGCLDGGDPARIATVDESLDLQLRDGRTIVLAGLEPVRNTGDGSTRATAQAALVHWLAERDVLVKPLASEPDRWGRTIGLVFTRGPADGSESTGRVSVAEAMLDAGYGRARPDPAVSAECWARFLALEAEARRQKFGLWSEAHYAVLSATDRALLETRVGMMALVEGRVVRVAEGRARLYLAFDRDGRDGFAITVERRLAAKLLKSGADVRNWKGRDLRVRGLLDDRFGLRIDLDSLDQVEFIPQ